MSSHKRNSSQRMRKHISMSASKYSSTRNHGGCEARTELNDTLVREQELVIEIDRLKATVKVLNSKNLIFNDLQDQVHLLKKALKEQEDLNNQLNERNKKLMATLRESENARTKL